MSDDRSPRNKLRRRSPKQPPTDVAILGGPTEDGQGAHLLRFRGGEVSAGEIRPVREGQSVTHRELVRLHPLDPERRVCRVETLHAPPAANAVAPEQPSSRPARVSNARYRKNWEAIFQAKAARSDPEWDVN